MTHEYDITLRTPRTKPHRGAENDSAAQNKEAATVTLDDIMNVVDNHDSVIEPLVSEWGRVYSNL